MRSTHHVCTCGPTASQNKHPTRIHMIREKNFVLRLRLVWFSLLSPATLSRTRRRPISEMQHNICLYYHISYGMPSDSEPPSPASSPRPVIIIRRWSRSPRTAPESITAELCIHHISRSYVAHIGSCRSSLLPTTYKQARAQLSMIQDERMQTETYIYIIDQSALSLYTVVEVDIGIKEAKIWIQSGYL